MVSSSMNQPTLSLFQKYRHFRLRRAVERERGTKSVMLKTGELLSLSRIDGYVWHLMNGRTVDVRSIHDAGSGKWLYRIYC